MARRVARALALAAAGAAGLGLAACESSQDKSARLRLAAKKAAKTTTITAGARNADVRVTGTTVLAAANASAVVVGLRNAGRAEQVAVPLQIQATDARGKVVYRNDLAGLQPALQQMALLRPGAKRYWVNDQVTAATPPKAVRVTIGAATGKATGSVPRIVLSRVKRERDSSGAFLSGIVRNLSHTPQVNMPIYGVVRRDHKVVAAGRAIVERLNPEPTKKPTIFRIFFIGKPKGGVLSLEAAPTVLQAKGSRP